MGLLVPAEASALFDFGPSAIEVSFRCGGEHVPIERIILPYALLALTIMGLGPRVLAG